jgi:hypothetical protein
VRPEPRRRGCNRASTAATVAGDPAGSVERAPAPAPVAEGAIGIAIDGAVEGGTRRIGGAHEQPRGAEIDVGRRLRQARRRHLDRGNGGRCSGVALRWRTGGCRHRRGRDRGDRGGAPRHGRPRSSRR